MAVRRGGGRGAAACDQQTEGEQPGGEQRAQLA